MNYRNNPLPPVVTEFYDDEERELYELVEGENFLPDGIDEERKCELQKAAQSMLDEKKIGISGVRDGVLLRSKSSLRKTTIADVASCLGYTGETKTLDDMEQAIRQDVKDWFHDCD
uniref:Transcriptional regulator, AbrB family n=1 Tax=Candidatus Kentrum eta TaxID=2126337 RepID=A0A450V2J9_9GAMM|nr:MAG: transcriptional regulator, AbrB family [Candidatus Kentron sp. H]VFJ99084.1 MAG: transcriptional regulator, AbrB family [Candidatus Kentron sp. H]VFK03835.1 MAG: transcriptional regulator, AbrB family [Candidatus Kentron sp. H]